MRWGDDLGTDGEHGRERIAQDGSMCGHLSRKCATVVACCALALMERRFLHLFSGGRDKLGEALIAEGKGAGLEVTVATTRPRATTF